MCLWLSGSRSSSLQKLRYPCVWRSVESGNPRVHWGPTAPAGWEGKASDTEGTGPPRTVRARSTDMLKDTETWKREWTRVRSVYAGVIWATSPKLRQTGKNKHDQHNCGRQAETLYMTYWQIDHQSTYKHNSSVILVELKIKNNDFKLTHTWILRLIKKSITKLFKYRALKMFFFLKSFNLTYQTMQTAHPISGLKISKSEGILCCRSKCLTFKWNINVCFCCLATRCVNAGKISCLSWQNQTCLTFNCRETGRFRELS